MATSRASLDVVPADLADRYGLRPVERVEPLGGGYHNTLLRAGDRVIRIEERAPESVAWEHALLAFLAEEIPEVLAPLPARDGSTFFVDGGRVVSVLPFVDGGRGGASVAELLARLHRRGLEWPAPGQRPGRPSYRDLDWERNDWWDWSLVPKPPELVRAFERVRRFVAEAPPLLVCPIHGDLAAQNLICRDGRVVALIDWEYARLDWPALELANAAWTLSDDPHAFVDAYAAAGGPAEREYLGEGIRLRLVANALYQLTRRAEGGAWSREWVDALLAELRELE